MVSSVSNFIPEDENIKAVPRKYMGDKAGWKPLNTEDRIRTHDLNWTEGMFERNKIKSN